MSAGSITISLIRRTAPPFRDLLRLRSLGVVRRLGGSDIPAVVLVSHLRVDARGVPVLHSYAEAAQGLAGRQSVSPQGRGRQACRQKQLMK